MKTGFTYHLNATKDWTKRQLLEYGPQRVFGFPASVTLSDALQIVDDDPREVFVIGECDNQDETGRCQGHRGEPNA